MDIENTIEYTLAYVNRNMSLGFIKATNLNVCITIPEDLIFVALRIDNVTIFDPDKSIHFTDIERLIIGLRGSFDLSFVKDSDYRKQNSQMCPVLPPLFLPPWSSMDLLWNYPIRVNVERSLDNINWTVYETQELNYSQNDNYYHNCFFRLHDTINNLYSNSRQYIMPQ